jgi:hypothetical protein
MKKNNSQKKINIGLGIIAGLICMAISPIPWLIKFIFYVGIGGYPSYGSVLSNMFWLSIIGIFFFISCVLGLIVSFRLRLLSIIMIVFVIIIMILPYIFY